MIQFYNSIQFTFLGNQIFSVQFAQLPTTDFRKQPALHSREGYIFYTSTLRNQLKICNQFATQIQVRKSAEYILYVEFFVVFRFSVVQDCCRLTLIFSPQRKQGQPRFFHRTFE